MTQALLNKLDITIEKTVNLVDKMPKTEGLDFGKLFESKTNNYNQNNKSEKSQDKTNIQSQRNDNLSDTKNNQTQKTIGDIKESAADSNTTQNNVQEKTADELNVVNAVNSIKEDSNTQESTENNNDTITEDEIINIIDETTITEEDPTMYNELNTLEDPTTMLLLQTQIQKNIKNCLDDEMPDDFNEENTNFKMADNILNNSNLFKQSETTNFKDTGIKQFAQNIIPKDTVQTKNTNSKISDVINENIVKELNVEVVSAESADAQASFGDLMQNQSPQEQAARVMIQGDIKYEAISAKTTQNVQVKPTTITPSKIIEQITKQLDGMVNNSKLNMLLNPGSLGKVNVQLMNTKDGLMAQFTVTTQDVKDILMKGLDGLKESLLAQGISVDNVSVKLEETDSEYQSDYTEQEGSRGGNKQQGSKQQKENEKTFEELIRANVEEKSEA